MWYCWYYCRREQTGVSLSSPFAAFIALQEEGSCRAGAGIPAKPSHAYQSGPAVRPGCVNQPGANPRSALMSCVYGLGKCNQDVGSLEGLERAGPSSAAPVVAALHANTYVETSHRWIWAINSNQH